MSESQVKATSKLTRSLLVWGFCLWIMSIYVRLSYFPFVQVTSDTLSPLVGAIRWWNTGWFGAANPESDQWLWMLSAPLLFLSSSLSDLFWWKCVATTITIPSACWLVIQTTEKHHWFWMLVVSTILTLDMGLVDTMLSFFRGYWAPECMTVAIIGLLCWQRGYWWGAVLTTVATVIAMGQHPLVLGTTPALIWLWWKQYRRSEFWWVSVGMSVVLLLPRLVWVYHLMQCDSGGLTCLTNIAVSSSESEVSIAGMLLRVLHDRLWIEMGLGSLLMIVGWWYAENKELKYWLLWSVLGIFLLGISISTLRPYHFRVLIVPMFVLSIQGLSKMRMKGLIAGSLWIGSVVFHRIEPVSWYDEVDEADEIAGILCEQTSPIWLEGFGSTLSVSPQSVGVSMFTKRCPAPIANQPTVDVWVVVPTSEEISTGEIEWAGSTHQLRRVSWTDWMQMPQDEKWSGHDVASLFWDESSIALE